jgi:hypothetical protein
MAGASSYYKHLYKRRFSDPIEDKENRHAVSVSACNVMGTVHHFNKNWQYRVIKVAITHPLMSIKSSMECNVQLTSLFYWGLGVNC